MNWCTGEQTTTMFGLAREAQRPAPRMPERYKREIHCVACHTNTWARRSIDSDTGRPGATCWECGAFYPDVSECFWHDPRVTLCETPDDYAAILAGEWCGDDECFIRWDFTDTLPMPRTEGCTDCRIPYLVTRWDADAQLREFLTPRGEWSPRVDLAEPFTSSIDAYRAARDHGGRSHRADTVI